MLRSLATSLNFWSLGGLWLAVVAGAVWAQAPKEEALPPTVTIPTINAPAGPELSKSASPSPSNFIGVSSCAASSCHGGTKVDRGYLKADPLPWRSAYIVWATEDRHSRAFQVLYGDLAKSIVQKLDHLPQPADARPYEDRRCLSCHATTDPRADAVSVRKSPLLLDGVSCESCHGAAQPWLGMHFTQGFGESEAAFRARRTSQGMTDTDDMVVRAETCAGCHVGRREGSDVRDMNHDMIAAGHPSLNFEFSAYLARMPRHWRLPSDDLQFAVGDARRRTATDDDAHREQADREYQSWAVGKLVTSAAFLKLTAGRAEAAQTTHGAKAAPWPEFSGFDCYRCHHALRGEETGGVGPQQVTALARMEADKLRIDEQLWETWGARYTASTQFDTNERLALSKQLWNPLLDDKQLTALAATLRKAHAEKLREAAPAAAATSFDSTTAAEAFQAEAAAGAVGAISWDRASQAYLGCVALYRARKAAAGQPLDTADDDEGQTLKDLLDELRFDPAEQRAFNSPVGYDSAEVRALFEKLTAGDKAGTK